MAEESPRGDRPLTPYSLEAVAVRWLRRRILVEAGCQFFEAGFFGAVGLAFMALVAGIVTYAFWVGTSDFGVTWPPAGSFAAIFLAVFLGIALVSFGVLWRKSERSDFATLKDWLEHPFFPSRTAELDFDVLASGARLVGKAGQSLFAAWRLFKADAALLEPIIVWLWQKRAKASSDEILLRFPEINTVRIFSQMREIPGIIWLPGPRGIFILSQEFRRDFESHFAPRGGAQPAGADEPAPDAAEREVDANTEIIGWYAALELPPYAPMPAVKRKYRQLAKKYHPDAARSSPHAVPPERMVRINLAYQNIIHHYRKRNDS